MNHSYRLIWNAITRTLVAVSEVTKTPGKGAAGKAARVRSAVTAAAERLQLLATSLAAAVCLCFTPTTFAQNILPTGGVVSQGAASVTQTASSMTVNQTSQMAAINWQSFSIGAANAVRFVQPGSTSIALNRVLGQDASAIMGSLTANGQVFLLNPNGVLFGSGSSVNVGGLVASTLGMTDANFMAGRYKT